jgi:hypothetical protein
VTNRIGAELSPLRAPAREKGPEPVRLIEGRDDHGDHPRTSLTARHARRFGARAEFANSHPGSIQLLALKQEDKSQERDHVQCVPNFLPSLAFDKVRALSPEVCKPSA